MTIFSNVVHRKDREGGGDSIDHLKKSPTVQIPSSNPLLQMITDDSFLFNPESNFYLFDFRM